MLPLPSSLTAVGPQSSFSTLADSSRSPVVPKPPGRSTEGDRLDSNRSAPSSGLASKYSLAQVGGFRLAAQGSQQFAAGGQHAHPLVAPVGYID